MKDLTSIRREYGQRFLSEKDVSLNPFEQFGRWFKEVMEHEVDPLAMTLGTVDEGGLPNLRVVLLKEIKEEKFVFYTNYNSTKARELTKNPSAALNFYWPVTSRQVRVRGTVDRVPSEWSDEYFASRPKPSQIAALASSQSELLASRKTLEERVEKLTIEYTDKPVLRPENWGGFYMEPFSIEFWQGRDNRLHDRLRYRKEGCQWIIERLFP